MNMVDIVGKLGFQFLTHLCDRVFLQQFGHVYFYQIGDFYFISCKLQNPQVKFFA
jgi:hypothetical protein